MIGARGQGQHPALGGRTREGLQGLPEPMPSLPGRVLGDTAELRALGAPTARGFPGGASGEEPACQCPRHRARGLNPWVRKIPLEEERASPSSILVWEIPWTEEAGGHGPWGHNESDGIGGTEQAHIEKERGGIRRRGDSGAQRECECHFL